MDGRSLIFPGGGVGDWSIHVNDSGGEFDCSVEKSVDFSVEFLSLIN